MAHRATKLLQLRNARSVETGLTLMRVLFVPAWYPSQRDSNNGQFNREIALAASKFVELLVLIVKNDLGRYLPSLHKLEYNDPIGGFPVVDATVAKSPLPKTTFLLYDYYHRKLLDEVVDKFGTPDVIHTQAINSYRVFRQTRHLRVPYVISQHWTSVYQRSLPRRSVRHFRKTFSEARFVLPANAFVEDDYAYYGFEANVRWLPNVLNTEIFCNSPKSSRKPWLLHTSGLTPQKRVSDIIEAFKLVQAQRPKAELHITGEGIARKKYEQLAHKLLPSGSFAFHGFFQDKHELADMMRQCCGFVFPSEAENFGVALMEAMACGCPVVTTQAGGIRAVVRGKEEGLIIDVGNVPQLADAMTRLIDGSHNLDTYKIAQSVYERFNQNRIGRMLFDIYKECIR